MAKSIFFLILGIMAGGTIGYVTGVQSLDEQPGGGDSIALAPVPVEPQVKARRFEETLPDVPPPVSGFGSFGEALRAVRTETPARGGGVITGAVLTAAGDAY